MNLVRVPKIAESVTEGTVVRWHVREGDRVTAGQPLVEMITEKAEGDVYAPGAGRVALLSASERSTVPVGYVLCVLAEESEPLPDVQTLNAAVMERHRAELFGGPAVPERVDLPTGFTTPGCHSVEATPAARRLARAKGIDIRDIPRLPGVSRMISEEDVRRHVEGADQHV
jgi:pyruvate/2-oxoglutarate dehydrogenase complex dihydrolipoamide acyltransferase (E2) component